MTMSDAGCFLSVVVAAYNEEAVIAENLRRIAKELSGREGVQWEIICVDDGSTDRTGALMDEIAAEVPQVRVLHHRRNFGQGRALRTAFDACLGEIIITLDADLSYGPEYTYVLADSLVRENVEIALASPYAKGGRVQNVPFCRRLLSRVGNWYLARMSNYSISTSTCAVRAYRREVFDAIVLTSDGMELQLEVLMKASQMNFRVVEVPAHLQWAKRRAGEAKQRVSKMRILRVVRLYLLLGWLSRPAMVFMVLAWAMLLPGLYMAVVLMGRTMGLVFRYLDRGLAQAVSDALSTVFENYTYSVAFCGVLLVLGFQTFVFSLLLLQNKFYFDELSRLQSARLKGQP
jgi:dolichol-phosphate mannosyltransferase